MVGWRIGGFVILALVVLLFALPLILGFTSYPGYFYYYPRPYPFFFFFPFGFLFFGFIVFFVLRWVFWGWGRRGGGGYYYYYGHRRGYWHGDAAQILRQRYARGEISKEQFDQMMRDIGERSA